MHYYRSLELAEQYGVSRRTITNWVDRSRQGRLDLELLRIGGGDYIAKTPKNQVRMKTLVEDHRKFLNKRSHKVVTPTAEFYQIFSERQMLDIISNIDTYREIPIQYSYMDEGAELWDRYAKRLHTDDTPNLLTQTIALLEDNASYINKVLAKCERVNVVDVGPGNSLPVRDFLGRLHQMGKLGKYIAIDISQDMLDIAGRNIREWFNGDVVFEGHVRDISREQFGDILAEPPSKSGVSTTNLVLLFGGTASNLRLPLSGLAAVCESMSRNDLLIYTMKLDTPATREHLDFRADTSSRHSFLPQNKLVLDLLGIDEEHYEPEMGFNEQKRARFARIRLKHALTIEFQHAKGIWPVDLKKDDVLLLMNIHHDTAEGIIDKLSTVGFDPLLSSQTQSHDYILVLADLRKNDR